MKRILVVEDNLDVLESLAVILEYNDYTVATASNGAEALGELERDWFDLILLDLMMPVMDGATMVREMRRRGTTTPVMLLSALDDLPRVVRELGVVAALPKPFRIEALQERLERFFHGEPSSSGGAGPAPGSGPGRGGGAPSRGGAPPRGGVLASPDLHSSI